MMKTIQVSWLVTLLIVAGLATKVQPFTTHTQHCQPRRSRSNAASSLILRTFSRRNSITTPDNQELEFSNKKDGDLRKRRRPSLLIHPARRAVLTSLLTTATVLVGSITTSKPAQALLTDRNTPDVEKFAAGQTISLDEAKRRFRLAQRDIDELIARYDDISAGGGDNVRLYLGTQGVKSHMYGITKIVRVLRDSVDDIVAFTEAATEFEAYLYQAEGAAYQSIFVEFSSAKGTPAQFLATAKKDAIVMRKYMQEMADMLVD